MGNFVGGRRIEDAQCPVHALSRNPGISHGFWPSELYDWKRGRAKLKGHTAQEIGRIVPSPTPPHIEQQP